MTIITFKGNALTTDFALPNIGTQAPDFKLVATDLSEATLATFSGKSVIMNIYPSVDTPTCALSTKKFNDKVSQLNNVVVLCIAKDTPFAFNRFIDSNQTKNIIALSAFRDQDFGINYGVLIKDSVLQGLFCRAIVVIDQQGIITHTEIVSEIANEPDYEVALQTISN